MAKQEAPLEYLSRYIPAKSVPRVIQYLNRYQVHLTVTRERKSVLGDYRHATHQENHRISVNSNLNPYAFLITLIHELAHLVTFMQWGRTVAPHGKEWKHVYAHLMKDFMDLSIFPEVIHQHLIQSIHNLPASSCSDLTLMRILKQFDPVNPSVMLIEQLPEGALFLAEGKRVFRKGKKLRKRYHCVEIATNKAYLFSPIYEVELKSGV